MYWKQLEAFLFYAPYLVGAARGDTHRGKYTHSYLVMPPRARLLHNICPTFIWPDAASQREMDEVEGRGEERVEADAARGFGMGGEAWGEKKNEQMKMKR